jgi:fructosamine-3-kinase
MIARELLERLEAGLGVRVLRTEPLSGGCVADVRVAVLDDGSRCVIKAGIASAVATEAWMLAYLRRHSAIPVPAVLWSDDHLLAMEYVDHDSGPITGRTERHAADLVAGLHGVVAPYCGLERDTRIGGLEQPNERSSSWIVFFRDRRLLGMGRRALEAGAIDLPTIAMLERLCGRLEEWIDEPSSPALLHGDLWGGNVLVRAGRIAGFVDPAIYYGHPEIELAFTTLFATFGEAFFSRYEEHRPLAPGFFEVRRDLYNLYPLLVHAVLFGSSYAAAIDRTLRRLVG